MTKDLTKKDIQKDSRSPTSNSGEIGLKRLSAMRFWSLVPGAAAVLLDCGPLRVHQLQLGRMQNYQRLAFKHASILDIML